MKILVIGASQGTGALTVKEALARGHQVGAFARSPQKLEFEHPHLKKIQGDFHNRDSVINAVKGYDAVIITASASSLSQFKTNPTFFSQGTGYVLEALKGSTCKVVILSALGVAESRPLLPFFMRKLICDLILKIPYADHERQEQMVRDSNLNWVIARPSRLSNGPALRKYQKKIGQNRVPSSISRADVADFLIEAATTNAWLSQAVQLGG